MKLTGKIAIITGGSKGIGLGCAQVFSKHGATVVIASPFEEDGQAAEKALIEGGAKAMWMKTDVKHEAQIAALIDTTLARFGKLDIIINNAGWHPPAAAIDDIPLGEFESIIRLNLTSTFLGCKLAAPHLRRTRGSIVNIASLVGMVGQAQAVSYVTSKAGQIGLTKALALDLAKDGVRVNAVCPAGVLTPMMKEWAGTLDNPVEALKKEDANHALGRMATSEEIGEVCAFLASDEARFITGQAICPDGGASLGYQRW
ncbi:MAG: SDR family NAD(P)-dependent oxidoreductase [Phycisphaeraceae bacterium]